MTARRMAQLAIVLGAVVLGALLLFGGQVHALRSAHARPGVVDIAGLVAVTPEGKLFHDPKCSLVHGPTTLLDEAEAMRAGYTPCTRCLARALGPEH